MPNILIVDDEEVTRMMIRRVLGDYGFEVHQAVNGQDAVAMVQAQPIDLVLMDVRMPVMNGFDACRAIRNETATQRLPILMLTALDDVMAVTLAFEAGATDFITKPINWSLLSQRVRYALRTYATERDLRSSQQTLARAQRIAKLGQWRLDLSNCEITCSQELCERLRPVTGGRMPIREFRRMLNPDDRRALSAFGRSIRAGKPTADIEVRVDFPDQSVRYLALSGGLDADSPGGVSALFGVAQDVTERRHAEARLSYQAHFDTITALPNRVLFRDRVDTAMAAAASQGRRMAVMSIDIDVLHKAQATLPQAGSDRMLREVAQRLLLAAGDHDTVCRLDGNAFAMLLADLPDERRAARVATRVMDVFAKPLAVGERELLLMANVGIAVFPGDGSDVDTLLVHAGSAKARAHQSTGSTYHFYTADTHARVLTQFNTEVALFRGLERNEFELHYQPKVDLRHGRTMGVEALLRWNRPGVGLQPPDSFIPMLEQTGLIMEAGDWVLRAACKAVRDLPLTLAVNMSPRQFLHPNMVDRIVRILQEVDFPAERLELEITEQIVMDDESDTVRTLHALSKMGIRVVLDDYGTGFSSLQRLKTLPLHTLKIDKTFVTSLVANKDDAAIVRSTIDLCHKLGILVVAEGVEDKDAMRMLAEFGCDIVQGYGVCRPLTLAKLTEWLNTSDFAPLDAIDRYPLL
jgi:diguanylate cyclase (GGDEF)-like protein